MIVLTLAQAAHALAAPLRGADATFRGVSTDTRTLERGQLFFALRGPNFDAHEKLADAAAAGAVGAVVERVQALGLPQIEVADTRVALGHLAHAWRERFAQPVLAVTGSAGKTTVKEMLAAIMRTRGPVLATRGNLNNDIGVPLTLFGLDLHHQSAVIEMGANHAGDIALLAAIARPRVGVVTLCAPAHLAGFGSVEGVARAKGEMFSALPAAGVAIVNAEDTYASLWLALAGTRRVITFGKGGMVHAQTVHAAAEGTRFSLCLPDGTTAAVALPHRGQHNVRNALAAAAAAHAVDVPAADIARGLGAAETVHGRLEYRDGPCGARIIDDTYNANPASIAAALAVLATEAAPRWLVFGNMGELGPEAARYHREVGSAATAARVERMFTLGHLAAEALAAYAGNGVACTDHAELIAAIDVAISTGGAAPTILIKGSRSMTLDVVADALAARSDRTCS